MMVKPRNRIQVLASLSVGASLVVMTFANSIILAYAQVPPVYDPIDLPTHTYDLWITQSNGSNIRYPINYQIVYDKLKEVTVNSERNSLTVKVESEGVGGALLIAIPRNILDATEGDDNGNQNGTRDSDFTVLLNGQQVDYGETYDESYITSELEIENPASVRAIAISTPKWFPNETKQLEIEIIGTWAVPEFPINLFVVTALGLIGVMIVARFSNRKLSCC